MNKAQQLTSKSLRNDYPILLYIPRGHFRRRSAGTNTLAHPGPTDCTVQTLYVQTFYSTRTFQDQKTKKHSSTSVGAVSTQKNSPTAQQPNEFISSSFRYLPIAPHPLPSAFRPLPSAAIGTPQSEPPPPSTDW